MPNAASTDLRAYTGYLLRRAYVRSTGVAQACVTDDARLRELGALSVLAEHGAIAQRRLGQLCQLSPTLVVKLVDAMQDKGLVARERSVSDRRVQVLRLTPAGASARAEQEANLDRAEAELISGLSRAEVQRLKAHLRRLLQDSPVLEAGPLADHVGYLVAHAHRRMRDDASKRLARLRLHPRDFGLLNLLAQEAPCSQAHLAERLGVSPPAVLALLDALEAQGLVGRERSEQDRRVTEVNLTANGRQILGEARQTAGGIQSEVVERLGAEGDADLRDLLTRLAS
jgi:DNA-binding MarR family transcriptional regulator